MKFVRSLVIFAASVGTAIAQQPTTPIVQIDPVTVEETLLSGDATGMTRVRFDDTAPASARSLTALTNRIANLHVSAGGAGSFGDPISLRGLTNTPFFSDPSVTVYFGDIPLGSSFSYPTGLFGFSVATLHRGPQSTAFARGGQAGVLVLAPFEPHAKPAGEIRASVGNYDARSMSVEARSGAGGRADVAFAGAAMARDGYIENRTIGGDVDHQESLSANLRTRVRPTATSEVSLQLLGQRRRDGAQPLVPLGGPLFSVRRGREGRLESDLFGAALKGTIDTAAGRLTATTSHTAWTLSPYESHMVLPPPLDSVIEQSQRNWNQEVRLNSGAKSVITWHAGVWLSDGDTDGEVRRSLRFATPAGLSLIPIEVSAFDLGSRTAALFAEATIPPNIGWTVTGGLRLERTRRTFHRTQVDVVPGTGPTPAIRSRQTFDAVLPKLTASYALTNDTTFSATAGLATKPGGWSAYTANPALARFDAEKATMLEAGVDTAFADGSVTLAARIFGYWIRDYQIERSFNAVDYLVVNAPRARSLGGELEGSWRPIEALTFTASVGMTDITLRRFIDPFTGQNFAGKRAPYAPEYEAHLSATYRARSGLFAAVEVAAVGETFFEESEDATFAGDEHATVNARLGYQTSRWRLTLFGENLGDERYYALVIPGVGHSAPGAPLTYGIEASVRW